MEFNTKLMLYAYCRKIRGCEYHSLKKSGKDKILKMFLDFEKERYSERMLNAVI